MRAAPWTHRASARWSCAMPIARPPRSGSTCARCGSCSPGRPRREMGRRSMTSWAALGHADVSERMLARLDASIAAANALPDSLITALTTDYDHVVATHRAVAAFTADLKSQFLTLLALEIPDDV